MTQDDMILTLLRAMAKAMVCPICRGTGLVEGYPGSQGGIAPKVPCDCRTAIRDLLKPQGV